MLGYGAGSGLPGADSCKEGRLIFLNGFKLKNTLKNMAQNYRKKAKAYGTVRTSEPGIP